MKKTIKVSLNDMGMPSIPKNVLNGNEVNTNIKNVDIKTSEDHVNNMNIITDEN